MKLQKLNALLVGCFALLANPAAAVDYSSPSLTIDVYAGGISSNEIAKKQLWMMIQGLQTGAPVTLLPELIHIEHSLKRPFDLAESAKSADGQKIDIAAHVESDQASGKVKIAFSKLGWSPGYAGATELLVGPNEHRVLRLPVVQEGDATCKAGQPANQAVPQGGIAIHIILISNIRLFDQIKDRFFNWKWRYEFDSAYPQTAICNVMLGCGRNA